MDLVPVNPAGNLFVSGDVEDWEALGERGIDTIVDMDGDIDPGLPEVPNGIFYVYHPILDEDLPDLTKIEALGRLVADLVSAKHRVLVHCRMGLNRSVLVIATALTYLGMTGEQAVAHLRGCRPGALFNEAFAAHVLGLPARRVLIQTFTPGPVGGPTGGP